MIKCVIQGFNLTLDGKYCIYSGFNNGGAIVTVENARGFKNITLKDAHDIFNNRTVCPLNAPDATLSKRHNRHILKGIKQNG